VRSVRYYHADYHLALLCSRTHAHHLPPPPSRTIPRSTIAELQQFKASSLPWCSWELGSKAAQAQELAEWLYWHQVTWPNIRANLGCSRDDPGALI